MSKVGRTDGEAVLWHVCLLVLESRRQSATIDRMVPGGRLLSADENLDAVVME